MTEWVKLEAGESTPDGTALRRTMVETGTYTRVAGFVAENTISVLFEKVKPPLPKTVGSVIKAVSPDTGDKATVFVCSEDNTYPWFHIGGDLAFKEEHLTDIEIVFTAPEGLLKR